MATIVIDSEGVKHLPPTHLTTFSTACGDCDIMEKTYEDAEGLPNCKACIEVAAVIFESITKKEFNKVILSGNWI